MRLILCVALIAVASACSDYPAPADDSQLAARQQPAAQPAPAPAKPVEADRAKPAPSPAKQTAAEPAKPDQTQGKPEANADAVVLADFGKRVDAYVDLKKKASKDAPTLKETDDPAKIKLAQDTLAARIRDLRAGARPGDIFSPEIQRKFRRLLAPEMKGEQGRDAKEVMKDDAPTSVPLKVNAKYPEGAALPTVPASLLASLPRLPDELEYRVIGKHLILLDSQADIIIDYMPNAIA